MFMSALPSYNPYIGNGCRLVNTKKHKKQKKVYTLARLAIIRLELVGFDNVGIRYLVEYVSTHRANTPRAQHS